MTDHDNEMPEVESQEVPDDATQPVADATPEGREAQLEDELEALLSEVLSSTSAPAGEVDMPAAEGPDAFAAPQVAAPQADEAPATEGPDAPTMLIGAVPAAPTTVLDEPAELAQGATGEMPEPTIEVPLMQVSEGRVLDDDAMVGYESRHGKQQEGRRGGAASGFLRAIGVTLIAAAAIYLAGVVLFTFYFMPNTSINGESVSFMLASEVAERHTSRTQEYTLHVSGQGLDMDVHAEDVNLRSDGLAFVTDARDQLDPWSWPLLILESHSLEVEESITFDEAKVGQLVGSAVKAANEGATKSQDAKVAFDEVSHLYKVVPEVMGTELDAKAVTAQVSEALVDMRNKVELTDDVMLRPTVTSDDEKLNAAVADVNAHLGAVQHLYVGDKEVFVAGADVIGRFTTVSDDLKVTVDHEALKEWAQGELSEKLDSTGSSRALVRPDGKKIQVKGGNYGWTINGAELSEIIATNIEEGKEADIEVPMLETAQFWNPGGQEWGKRYIDIDITEQHVRMYGDDGNVIWESDCVTGNPSEKHDTPEGVYALNSNRETGNVVLEGPEDKETLEPEYVSYVTYWMPFIWNSVALHDATWRYSFGGDIYKTDGSHGCVNLPYDKAEQLYGLTKVGDVVVVHY